MTCDHSYTAKPDTGIRYCEHCLHEEPEPREGWYIVLHDGRPTDLPFIKRHDGKWIDAEGEEFDEWPFKTFTLGPHIDALIRDATQLKQAARAWARLARGDFILGDDALVSAWNKLAEIFDAEIAREGGR